MPAGNAPDRHGLMRQRASALCGYFLPHLVPAPLQPRFGPQQASPQVTFGLPPLVNPHGAGVVVVGATVVVVVPPVQAWSMPQEESFSQVWHSPPPLPQLALLVPAEQAPFAVQQPLKSESPQNDEDASQETPPTPQT